MIPYWMDLSISDLMQGTGFAAMAFIVMAFHFLMSSARA